MFDARYSFTIEKGRYVSALVPKTVFVLGHLVDEERTRIVLQNYSDFLLRLSADKSAKHDEERRGKLFPDKRHGTLCFRCEVTDARVRLISRVRGLYAHAAETAVARFVQRSKVQRVLMS